MFTQTLKVLWEGKGDAPSKHNKNLRDPSLCDATRNNDRVNQLFGQSSCDNLVFDWFSSPNGADRPKSDYPALQSIDIIFSLSPGKSDFPIFLIINQPTDRMPILLETTRDRRAGRIPFTILDFSLSVNWQACVPNPKYISTHYIISLITMRCGSYGWSGCTYKCCAVATTDSQ